MTVHQRCLKASLARPEEIEPEAVRRVHARDAVASKVAPLAGVVPPEHDMRRLLRARGRSGPVGEVVRIGDRAAEVEPAGAPRAEEHDGHQGPGGPEGSSRAAAHVVDASAAQMAASPSKRSRTPAGNRRGRPPASAQTSQVRAWASVASSSARAIR